MRISQCYAQFKLYSDFSQNERDFGFLERTWREQAYLYERNVGKPTSVDQYKMRWNHMTEFQVYCDEIRAKYPKTMSKDQFRKVAHISKATALFLIQSGLVPCRDSGKKTRRYTIRTEDVISYLSDRILYPHKYKACEGWYHDKSSGKNIRRSLSSRFSFTDEQTELLRQYYESQMQALDDLLTIKQLAAFMGYDSTTIVNWCNKRGLKSFSISGKFLIPKESAIHFIASPAICAMAQKSYIHKLYLSDFLATQRDHSKTDWKGDMKFK